MSLRTYLLTTNKVGFFEFTLQKSPLPAEVLFDIAKVITDWKEKQLKEKEAKP